MEDLLKLSVDIYGNAANCSIRRHVSLSLQSQLEWVTDVSRTRNWEEERQLRSLKGREGKPTNEAIILS